MFWPSGGHCTTSSEDWVDPSRRRTMIAQLAMAFYMENAKNKVALRRILWDSNFVYYKKVCSRANRRFLESWTILLLKTSHGLLKLLIV